MTNILFIIGVGRSGTTLLQNMMNGHPHVAFIPEINYPRRFLFNKKLSKLYKRDKDDFFQFIKNDKWFKRLDKRILNEIDFETIDKSNFELEFYKQIFTQNCKLNNKSIAGDKDPRSIELVRKINRIIPNIQWVHIVRDPRDVVLSKIKADWSKKGSLFRHIFVSYLQLMLAVKWKKLLKDKFTEIYYEDLITNPEQTLKYLCSEIGLEYNSKMLNYKESAKILVAQDEHSWKKEVFSPIIKDNYSKWEHELDTKTIILIENLVKPAFDNYYYNRNNPKENIYLKIQIMFLKPIFYILNKLYCLVKQL